MKQTQNNQTNLRLTVLGLLTICFIPSTKADVFTWNRQAMGQPYLVCPDGSGGYVTNYWPNNSFWSQVTHAGPNCDGTPNSVTSQPSNWTPSSTNYPNGTGVDVVLGAPSPTILDVNVRLHSLAIQSAGSLQMWGASATADILDLQGEGGITGVTPGGFIYLPSGGTLRKSGGTGTFAMNNVWLFGTNSTLAVTSGTLALPSYTRLQKGGALAVSDGAVLHLTPDDSCQVLLGGLFTGTGTGTVLLDRGWLIGDDGGGGLALPGAMFQWTGGVIQGSFYNATSVTNAGTMTVHVVNGATLNGGPTLYGCDLVNTGTINLQDPGALLILSSFIHNRPGGIIDLQADNGVNGGGSYINNAGLFRKSGGSGTSVIDSSFNLLGGTIEVRQGTLALRSGGVSSNGTYVVAGGATIEVTGPNYPVTFIGYFTGAGAGTVLLDQGTVLTGIGPATFDFPNNMFQWNGGMIHSGAELFTNAGTAHIGGPVMLSSGANRGTIIQSGDGILTLEGSLYNLASGIYEFQSDNGILDQNGVFANDGLLRKTGGAGTTVIGAAAVNNAGTIQADTGTLAFTGAFYQNGGTLTLKGDSISIRSMMGINGGTVTGAGAIPGSVVNNAGNIEPGSPLGTISVGGDFTQRGFGTLNIDLGGRNPGQYDQLAILGNATLGGILNIGLTNGYHPTPGDQFQILACGVRVSAFDTVSVPDGISVNYSNNGVYLLVTNGITPPVQITAPQLSAGSFTFAFPTAPNQSYTVEQATNIFPPGWFLFTNFNGNGLPAQFSVPATNETPLFFRVLQP